MGRAVGHPQQRGAPVLTDPPTKLPGRVSRHEGFAHFGAGGGSGTGTSGSSGSGGYGRGSSAYGGGSSGGAGGSVTGRGGAGGFGSAEGGSLTRPPGLSAGIGAGIALSILSCVQYSSTFEGGSGFVTYELPPTGSFTSAESGEAPLLACTASADPVSVRITAALTAMTVSPVFLVTGSHRIEHVEDFSVMRSRVQSRL